MGRHNRPGTCQEGARNSPGSRLHILLTLQGTLAKEGSWGRPLCPRRSARPRPRDLNCGLFLLSSDRFPFSLIDLSFILRSSLASLLFALGISVCFPPHSFTHSFLPILPFSAKPHSFLLPLPLLPLFHQAPPTLTHRLPRDAPRQHRPRSEAPRTRRTRFTLVDSL
jgi:hypothetical protein